MIRSTLTPAEFDARCRELEARHPGLSQTSGRRSTSRNRAAGGKPESKHVLGMARDYVHDDNSTEMLHAVATSALGLGLWVEVHDVGSGDHVHVQGLPPGPVPAWWAAKYLPAAPVPTEKA